MLYIELSALCGDAAGIRLVLEDIARAYGAGTSPGSRSSQDEEALQYADIAEWQSEVLDGEDGEVGRGFWKEYGVVNPVEIELPFGNGGDPPESFEIDMLEERARMMLNLVRQKIFKKTLEEVPGYAVDERP